MPLDAKTRRNLIKLQVKNREIEHDPKKSDKDRYDARHRADFYEQVRIKLSRSK